MTPETWKKIGSIVERALACAAADREQYLHQVYEEAPELRAEIEAMLAAYEENSDFLESPAISGITFDADALPSRYIGPYRVMRHIGQGGMGEVFLAQREDGPVNQPVAVKLIRAAGQETDFMLIRFQVEQQILSELNHPNIARLLDAGATDDGRPYFVMEYVDGLPITSYCDQHKLPVDQRLDLFVQACKAVQFAHQNFIVHRDLKPSNLLVTREGEVKLLDFGIAKALDPWQAGVAALETRTGFRVLTPPYASPEQVKGQPITTASDVYSLGILLYELLTGRRPYQLADKLEAEVVRVISETRPTPPSDAVTRHVDTQTADGVTRTRAPEHIGASRQTSVDRLQRKLKGELDNIVLMALRKEANRRYSSASELGADIRRHLEGLPVEAQPDSLGYRARKFVGRHRWGVAATMTIGLLLLAFGAVSLIQASRIRAQASIITQERDTAQHEAEKAQEIVDLLVGLFESANPNNVPGGDTLRVSEFLQNGAGEVLNSLQGRPEIQARMKHVIGEMYFAQGDYERALALFEDGHAQQDSLKGPGDLGTLAILQDLAMVHLQLGRRDTTIKLLETIAERLPPVDAEASSERATLLLTLAPLLPVGDHERKAGMLEEANALIEGLDKPDDIQRASASNQLGVFYFNLGEYAKARAPFEKTLTYLARAVGKSHPYYLITAGNLAGVYQHTDQFEAALALHQEVLSERKKLPANPSTRIGVAWTLNALGATSLLMGRWDDAEQYTEEAYALITAVYPEGHQGRAEYALSYADALIRKKRYAPANDLIQEALDLQAAQFGTTSAEYAWTLYKKANLQISRHQLAAARQSLTEAITIWLQHHPDGQQANLMDARLLRATIDLKQDKPAQALDALDEVLVYRSEHKATDAALNLVRLWKGVALSRLGRHAEAGPLLQAGRPMLDHPFYLNEEDIEGIKRAYSESGIKDLYE